MFTPIISLMTKPPTTRRRRALLLFVACLALEQDSAAAFAEKQRAFSKLHVGYRHADPDWATAGLARRSPSRLYYKDERTDGGGWTPNNNNNQKKSGVEKSVRRADVAGVSISDSGFLLLLSTSYIYGRNDNDGEGATPSSVVFPARVTSPPEDATSASSPEALTLIQLLSGIDMAGAVMHPTALQEVVGLFCSKDDDEDGGDGEDGIIVVEDELGLGVGEMGIFQESTIDAKSLVREFVAQTLKPGKEFRDAGAFARSRVQFPTMTLDGVRIELAEFTKIVDTEANIGGSVHPFPLKFVLEVTVQGNVRLDIPLYSEITSIDINSLNGEVYAAMEKSESILSEVCLTHNPDGSAAFLSLALALRYKSPVVFSSEVLDTLIETQVQRHGDQGKDTGGTVCILGDDCAISEALPEWKAVSALQSTSQRVVDNIEQSFEVHRLQGALRIATERGDSAAVEKISAELEKFDSFADLPTTEEGKMDANDDNDAGPCKI